MLSFEAGKTATRVEAAAHRRTREITTAETIVEATDSRGTRKATTTAPNEERTTASNETRVANRRLKQRLDEQGSQQQQNQDKVEQHLKNFATVYKQNTEELLALMEEKVERPRMMT